MDSIRQRGSQGNVRELRSLYWRVTTVLIAHILVSKTSHKIYLEYLPNLETSEWPSSLRNARQGYEDLKAKLIIDPTKLAKEAEDWSVVNPLSQNEDVRYSSFV